MKYISKLKQMPLLVMLAMLLVVPTVISAYAQPNDEEAPVVEQPVEVVPYEETPSVEVVVEDTPPPTPEPVDEEPPVTEEEQVTENVEDEDINNDETTEDPIEDADTPQAALDRYMSFAMAEHPGVEVSEVKFVWKNGVKSAKIVFEDGWKVYIGVSDGSTLSVADENNKVHRCQRRMRSWKPYFNWYKHYDSYYQWWMAQQQEDDDSEQTEGEAEVQGTSTSRDSDRRGSKKWGGHNKKYDRSR